MQTVSQSVAAVAKSAVLAAPALLTAKLVQN
jgi:hypothetical protein